MVPVCMWHSVQKQCFHLYVCRHSPHSSNSMGVGNCTESGTACDYLYNRSASVTQKLLCQPASNRTIPLVMGEMQFRASDPVEPIPRESTWWNTFAGTIFHSQVCWPQLPLSQPCCHLFLKAARDALEDIWSKLSYTLLLHVNARLMLDCKIFVDIIEIICNRWQVPCHNVQVLRR